MTEPLSLAIVVLFSLMAFRAFRSGSALDYLLAATQCAGLLLLLLSDFHQFASWLLLASAFCYLLSQILTGARLVSRLLPLAGAAAVALSLLM